MLLFITITIALYKWYSKSSEEQLRQQRIDKIQTDVFDYFDPMSSPELEHHIHRQLEIDPNGNTLNKFILHPIFDSYRKIFVDNNDIMDEYRRRLQFKPPTPPPTIPPSAPFKDADDPDIVEQLQIDQPYILVYFGDHHCSWNTGNEWCEDKLGTHLASVDKVHTEKLSQFEQIQEMERKCGEIPSELEIDCWIGLRWDNTTYRFKWENNQLLAPSWGQLISPDTIVSETNFGKSSKNVSNELGDGATPTETQVNGAQQVLYLS